MELDEVEPVHAEASERAVDDGLDVGPAQRGQQVEIGHVFGVDSDFLKRPEASALGVGAAEGTHDVLDTGIDVRTIEGGDAGIGRGDQVLDRVGAVDGTVPAGELPAAAQHARNVVVVGQTEALHASPRSKSALPWSRRG